MTTIIVEKALDLVAAGLIAISLIILGLIGTSLLATTQIRYAPTLALAVPDGRGRRSAGDYVVVQGQLFPREDESLGTEAVHALRRVVPRVRERLGL